MEQKERLDTCSNAKSFTLRKSQEAQSILDSTGWSEKKILESMTAGIEENYSSLGSTYNHET